MQFPITSLIAKNKLAWFLLVIFTGLALGLIILIFFFKLGLTIATFCSIGIIFPFIAIIIGDTKRLMWFLLCILLPVTIDKTINHTGHLGGAAGIIISLYDIVLAVLYLFWLIDIMSKREKKIDLYHEISVPFFLLGFSSLSVIPANYPELCVYEIIEIIKMYLTFVYLANNIKTKNDVNFIITIFIACLFFEGLLGFAQHRYDMPFFPTALGGSSSIDSRVMGTWRSYNDFAWYLTFFLPLAMSMTVSKIKYHYKIICFFALVCGTAALMWTNSRGGWISFGVAAIFVSILVIRKLRRKRTFVNIFLAIIAVSILLIPLYPRLYNKAYGRLAGPDRGAAESRFPQFEVAFNIIKENPFLGIGINNYTKTMWDYDTTEFGLQEITNQPVHNIFLHVTAEIGVLGLCTFLWFIIAVYYAGIRYVIMTNENSMVNIVIGLLAGILAFLIHGLFDTASLGSKLFTFLWFFAGLIFAVRRVKL